MQHVIRSNSRPHFLKTEEKKSSKESTSMATKNNTSAVKGSCLNDFKEKLTDMKDEPREENEYVNVLKKQPSKKKRKSKKKFDKIPREQEDQCLDSPPTIGIGTEVFGQPIPELYPELPEELGGPLDQGDNGRQQESQSVPGLQEFKENLDDSQTSSLDSQPIGLKKRRKMLMPKKVKKPDENLDGKQNEVLLEVTKQRTGSWVQCSLSQCGKWRCLNDKVDPNILPDRWVCSMNPDSRYNTCGASQEEFDSQDEDFDVVYSPYPEGAIVWAKLAGYPWWPGMMQNDPDYGYYCETEEETRVPISYHVVFFDKDVSRAWVNTCSVRPFQADDNPEDQGSVVIRKKNFKKKLDVAADQARAALSLSPESRLKTYGFEKRFKGPIGYQNKPPKEKKTKTAVAEKDDGEKDEEKDEEEEEDYMDSIESNVVSGSSENFSQEFFTETKKKKTSNKKINNKKADPSAMTKKITKRKSLKDVKNNASKRDLDTTAPVNTSSGDSKNNIRPRKKSANKTDKVSKNTSELEDRILNDTPVYLMNAVPRAGNGLDTIMDNPEYPKDPIASPCQETELSNQCVSMKKDNKMITKDKIMNPKKRKLADKKKGGQEKKKKTAEKETKQSKREEKAMAGSGSNIYVQVSTKVDAKARVKTTKKAAKNFTNESDVKTLEPGKDVKMAAGCLKTKPQSDVKCEKEAREDKLEEENSVKDIQISTQTTSFGQATKPCSLNFTNMPKLVKASFIPPSKNSKSCSKPTKMPKLWKPQFVCPVVDTKKANNLLKGKEKEHTFKNDSDKGEEMAPKKVDLKRSICESEERCSIDTKRPLRQPKKGNKDPVLSDEVEAELAKLDRDIEDMMRKFNNSANHSDSKKITSVDDALNISTEDSPEF